MPARRPAPRPARTSRRRKDVCMAVSIALQDAFGGPGVNEALAEGGADGAVHRAPALVPADDRLHGRGRALHALALHLAADVVGDDLPLPQADAATPHLGDEDLADDHVRGGQNVVEALGL